MPDASHRRAIPEDAVVRESADDGVAGSAGLCGESQAGATTDATDGFGGDLSQASNDGCCNGASEIPLFIAGSCGHAAQRSVGGGHHVHSDVDGIHVPGGGDRLVQPVRVVVAIVEQPGGKFLCGRVKRGVVTSASDDLQYRPGGSIHESFVHKPVGGGRGEHQHGRQRSSVGQRVCRTVVVEPEVRAHLPSCSSDGAVIAPRVGQVSSLLQSGASASKPGLPDTVGRLSRQGHGSGSKASRMKGVGDGPREWASSPLRFAGAHLRSDDAHSRGRTGLAGARLSKKSRFVV